MIPRVLPGRRYGQGHRARPPLNGGLAGGGGRDLTRAEELPVQPGQEHADLTGLVADADRRGAWRGGPRPAVPDVPVVEAVVVGKEHRLAGRNRGGAVRGGLAGDGPAAVVETGLGLGILGGGRPTDKKRQGERGRR